MLDEDVNGEVLTQLWSLKPSNTSIMVNLPTFVQNQTISPAMVNSHGYSYWMDLVCNSSSIPLQQHASLLRQYLT